MTAQTETGFLALARQRSVVLRAARIALIVGTILALINHGQRLVFGNVDGATVVRVGLTFLVPYSVSTFSSVLAIRERIQSGADRSS